MNRQVNRNVSVNRNVNSSVNVDRNVNVTRGLCRGPDVLLSRRRVGSPRRLLVACRRRDRGGRGDRDPDSGGGGLLGGPASRTQ